MKKRIVIIVVIIIILITTIFAGYFMKKKLDKKREEKLIRKAEIVLSEDLTVPFLEERKVSNFIVSMNGKIVDDYKIDTTSLGKKEIKFDFITDEGIKASYQYEIEVKDVIPPTVLLGGSYRVKKGSSSKFIDNILCGDDYDSNPKCEIVGDYDLNKEGSYPVVFKATDSSGNVTEKNFKLVVYVPKQGGGSNPPKPKTYFSDIVKEHKNDKTRIGIDISKWQGDVDFDALKKAGVEFVIIRVGTTNGRDGDYILDPKFIQKVNLEGEMKPKNYPLKKEASLVIEDKIRISFSIDNNITFFGSNYLQLKKIYEKNLSLLNLNKLELFVKNNSNLYIKGLGFFYNLTSCNFISKIFIHNANSIHTSTHFPPRKKRQQKSGLEKLHIYLH